MSIAKPIRHLLQGLVFWFCSALLLRVAFLRCSMPWAALLALSAIPIGWFIGLTFSILVVDAFDFWLRKRTRDPSWLWSEEGRLWLKTAEGQEWLGTKRGGE